MYVKSALKTGATYSVSGNNASPIFLSRLKHVAKDVRDEGGCTPFGYITTVL